MPILKFTFAHFKDLGNWLLNSVGELPKLNLTCRLFLTETSFCFVSGVRWVEKMDSIDNSLVGVHICVPSRLNLLLVEISPKFSSTCCEPNGFPEIL